MRPLHSGSPRTIFIELVLKEWKKNLVKLRRNFRMQIGDIFKKISELENHNFKINKLYIPKTKF